MSAQNVLDSIYDKIHVQNYGRKGKIDGVKIVDIKQFSGEDGMFEEVVRIDNGGVIAQFDNFAIAQINRSQILPGAVKAWHIHFEQEDIWYVEPSARVLLGLWDVRKESASSNTYDKIPLGFNSAKLVLIPRGVAHGVVNIGSKEATLLYFVNKQFSAENPDEHRLAWDSLGADFWKPEKG